MKNTKSNKQKILVVDDDQDILTLLTTWLSNEGFKVITAESGEQALMAFEQQSPSMIISDLFMGDVSGLDLLTTVHSMNPLLPIIILSGQASIPDAIKATHLGSAAFITKPIDKEELISNVNRYLRLSQDSDKKQIFDSKLIYKSKVMSEQIEMAYHVADSNVTVMLTGATGTGKEIFARAIHDASPRKGKPFIAINCGAIPEQLLESELFGHEKGAFSGAVTNHEGLFRAVNGGTLLLDEIGDMPLALQVKLLRVLQDFEVRPVGSIKSYPVDVRIISSTHRNLEERIESGDFREDLYYRLKVVPINIPDLKERPEDIPLLAAHFLQIYSDANNKPLKRLAPEVVDYLCALDWPGNIRQLMNVIDLCATLCKTDIIPLSLAKKASQEKPGIILTLKEARQNFEKNYLMSILRITGGHVANSAKLAGRNRTEFYKLLSQHGLDAADYRKSSNKK